MEGGLSKAMAAGKGKQQPLAGKPEQQPPEQQQSGEEQASPEEQEAFERIGLAVQKILYEDGVHEQIMQMLQAGLDTPAETLAQTAMMLFKRVDEEAGGKIPESVIIQGAIQVMEMLADMLKDTGTMEVDEQTMTKAAQLMIAQIIKMYDIDPEDAYGLMAGMGKDQLNQIVQQQQQIAGGANG